MKLDLKNYRNRHSLRSKLIRMTWNVVWLFLFYPTPKIGLNGWRIFLLKLFGAKIGKKCIVHRSCQVWAPWNLEVGDEVALSEHVNCYSVDTIFIEDCVTVSSWVFLCTASHDISSPIMELTYRPIRICRQAWIASRAFVGPGVTVGEGAVVAACGVVVKDVAPWDVVGGNPVRIIKKRGIRSPI